MCSDEEKINPARIYRVEIWDLPSEMENKKRNFSVSHEKTAKATKTRYKVKEREQFSPCVHQSFEADVT